jgi:hypothetical protein
MKIAEVEFVLVGPGRAIPASVAPASFIVGLVGGDDSEVSGAFRRSKDLAPGSAAIVLPDDDFLSGRILVGNSLHFPRNTADG